MTPMLGRVAKGISLTTGNKLFIGKLDCSRYKPTCNKYGKRSNPTLMYHCYDDNGGDGDDNGRLLLEYPLHPEESSILQFAGNSYQ
jgi:hypothetical protein